MFLRIVMAAMAGGLVLFVVSAVSWMALPFHGDSLQSIPQPAAEVDAFLDALPASGAYHWPGFPDDPGAEGAMEAMMERMEVGPNISLMIVHKEGSSPFSVWQFLGKLLLDIGAAGLASLLLATAGPSLRPYGMRVAFVASLGVFASLSSLGPEWLWWGYPAQMGIATLADHLVGWALVGVVVAAILRPDVQDR